MRPFVALVFLASVAQAAPAEKSVPAPVPPPAPNPYEGEGWKVSFSAPKTAKIGERRVLELAVEARTGFHLNDDFPINFVASAKDGASFESPRVDKKAATLAPCKNGEHACKASLALAFTPKTEGSQNIAGTFAFAVCDEKQCLIEKVPVSVEVAVR